MLHIRKKLSKSKCNICHFCFPELPVPTTHKLYSILLWWLSIVNIASSPRKAGADAKRAPLQLSTTTTKKHHQFWKPIRMVKLFHPSHMKDKDHISIFYNIYPLIISNVENSHWLDLTHSLNLRFNFCLTINLMFYKQFFGKHSNKN